MHALRDKHRKVVNRILRYLKGTSQFGLHLTKSLASNLMGFSNADRASSPYDRKSTSGYCMFLGSNLVTQCAKKQITISQSSYEVEYRGLASARTELLWLKSLLNDLRVPLFQHPTVWCENESAIALTYNLVFHAPTKHIDVDVHFKHEIVKAKHLFVKHVPSLDQIANVFTKSLSAPRFTNLCCTLTIMELHVHLQGNVRDKAQVITDKQIKFYLVHLSHYVIRS